MALNVKGIARTFTFKRNNETITLQDPDPAQTPDAVMGYYANLYPELTTATVHGPELKEDKAVYEFRTTIGTKG